MQNTGTPYTTSTPVEQGDSGARLEWLLAANAQEAQYRSLFRSGWEEEQMLLMRRPLSTPRVYALLGMMLGALPPAAIFTRLFHYGWHHEFEPGLFILCLLMNLVCIIVGYRTGKTVGSSILKLERASWHRMILSLLLVAVCWGAVTGGAGGLVFFIFGAIFGALFAIPVALAVLLLFAPLHRLLARGGMIEARQFWPLASGVILSITALLLRM